MSRVVRPGPRRVRLRNNPGRAGITLLEMLLVLAIMAILWQLSLPAFNAIVGANNITMGGETVGDQILFARQEALAKNRDVEVRFIQVSAASDPMNAGYRALQVWQLADSAAAVPPSWPLTKVIRLPQGTLISAHSLLSPLLTADSAVSGSADFGALGTQSYKGFRIKANGGLSSSVTTANNFLTIQSERETGLPPKNYYTVRLNPVSGRLSIFRP